MTKSQNQASAMTDEQKNTLIRIVDCLEILNKRPRPFCRDCADGDGVICTDSGLNCDMRKLIADGRAALESALAATPAQQTEAPKDSFQPSELVTLNGKQLKDLLDAAWPDRDDEDQANTEITLFKHPAPFKSTEGEDMPAGRYFYWTEYPEEGIVQIDAKEPA